MNRQPTGNLPALTGLRGIAAVWVLLFHVFKFQALGIPLVAQGYAGVDIFFLLSGFILSHVYMRSERFTAKEYFRFLGIRLARIYPLHLFTLCCLLIIVVAFPDFAASYRKYPGALGLDAFVANLFLVQNWGLTTYQSWNAPSWSLSAEWLAYLAFPFLLPSLKTAKSPSLLIALSAAVLASMICLLYLGSHQTLDVTEKAGMVRMAGEFTAGCLLYAAFAKGWRFPPRLGLVLMFVLLGTGLLAPSLSLFMVFGFALSVLLAAQGQTGYARFLEWRPILLLGEISYSLYMTHLIVIRLFNWLTENGRGWKTATEVPTILVIVLAVSLATYYFVEVPSRKFGRRLVLRPARLTIAEPSLPA
jgi:peptidoglycan/LPS O-acetylase OafA/YrhL